MTPFNHKRFAIPIMPAFDLPARPLPRCAGIRCASAGKTCRGASRTMQIKGAYAAWPKVTSRTGASSTCATRPKVTSCTGASSTGATRTRARISPPLRMARTLLPFLTPKRHYGLSPPPRMACALPLMICVFIALMASLGLAHADTPPPKGDANAGARAFRQCTSCHSVIDTNGTRLAGRGARVGPNLYRAINGPAGDVENFRYSSSLLQARAKGLYWTEENFIGFVQNPNGFLRTILDNPRARARMSYRAHKAQDAADIYAYLKGLNADGHQ